MSAWWAPLLGWLAGRRRRQMEHTWRDPVAVQERTLDALVRRARRTAWGQAHGFAEIRSVADYQRRVPLSVYADLSPWFARAIAGEADVTWPGRPRYYCQTSGTTEGDKRIPVTTEAFRAHRRGGLDTLVAAVHRVGDPQTLDGPLLFLGGSSRLRPLGSAAAVGDLSGLMVKDLPRWIRGRYSPGPEVVAIPEWEARLAATARLVRGQDLRLISGMPSWLLVLFERVRQSLGTLERTRPLGPLWPNLAVLVHGGVRMEPYRPVFDAVLGRPVHYIEVYPASEGFVALGFHASDPGLTLALDHGLFYEFIPVTDLNAPNPRRLTVAEVRIGDAYAIALTTPAGLWSYLLGDTVRFVSLDPPQVIITGRTRHFINAFGENVIVEEIERAAAEACRRTGAALGEFTVGPAYPGRQVPRACHQWAIEFRTPPASLAAFARALDEELQALNTDYRTKRAGDVGMSSPLVSPVAPGTFNQWLAAQGKLGDQHKVPRASNGRDLLDALLVKTARLIPA